jgi:hypothetical protein
MANYRTALGKTVDMSALAAKNEKTRAVGNMKINARGDTIDANGKIITPVTAKVNQAYAGTVGKRSGHVIKRQPIQKAESDLVDIPELVELTSAEKEIEVSFDDDLEIEQIKQEEVKTQESKKSKK